RSPFLEFSFIAPASLRPCGALPVIIPPFMASVLRAIGPGAFTGAENLVIAQALRLHARAAAEHQVRFIARLAGRLWPQVVAQVDQAEEMAGLVGHGDYVAPPAVGV